MYNRYIRTDHGGYTRIPQEEPQSQPPPPMEPSPQEEQPSSSHRADQKNNGDRISDGITSILRQILDQFHLNHVDTGDLLLLVLLFLLFREDADEEVLVALGLLLIL